MQFEANVSTALARNLFWGYFLPSLLYFSFHFLKIFSIFLGEEEAPEISWEFWERAVSSPNMALVHFICI